MSIKRFRWWFIPAAVVAAPVFIAAFVFISGGIVMLLWNWLLPTIVGLPVITVWQGFGLLALGRILFGGFGCGGGREKHMTREDREAFRRRMRDRFCGTSAESEGSIATANVSAEALGME